MAFFFSKKDSKSIINLIKEGDVKVISQIYQDYYPEILELVQEETQAQDLLKKAILVLRSLVLSNRVKEDFDVHKFLINWCKKQYEENQSSKDLEEKIYNSLKNNDGWAFYYINMTYLPSVIQYVKLHGGSKEDAEDVVQDAILALINNVNEGKYQLQESTKIKTYFIGICKNIWKEHLRRKARYATFSDFDFKIEEFEGYDFLYEITEYEALTERQKIVLEVFNSASDTCKQVLSYFYFKNYSHEEIAEKMGFSNAESSKTQKNKCLKKLKISVLNRMNQFN